MNPWNVDDLNAFCFLNCPECLFKSKEEEQFAAHAIESHPQSQVFFKIATDINLTEQNIAIDSITNEPSETLIIPEQILESMETKTSGGKQDVKFYIKVMDENDEPLDETSIAEISPKKSNSKRPSKRISEKPGSFLGLKKKKGQSIQALINVLDELSDDHFSCPVCEMPFSSIPKVKEHCKEEHSDKDGNMKCNGCSKTFDELWKYNKHYKTVHMKGKKETCHLCGKSMVPNALARHIKTVHGDKSEVFKCDLCDYTTHHKRYIYDHKYTKHAKKREEEGGGFLPEKAAFNCPYDGCEKSYTIKTNMQTHIDCYHKTGLIQYQEFPCEKCNSVFESPNFYLSHSQDVHKCVPKLLQKWATVKCDKCPQVFLSKGPCNQHKSRVHSTVPKRPKKFNKSCDYCGKNFSNQGGYYEHVKVVHENITPFHCKQCSQKFGTKSKLQSHVVQVHTKVNCHVCGMQQYNPFYLKKHIASAHGIVPPGSFKCKQCPMWFKYQPSLQKHLMSKHSI